jgi:ATP-dependent Clp protease ATP-binding subunit ClpC
MVKCHRCKQRMAVVYITRMEGDQTFNEGLCLICAKELGIAPVTDMINRMNISDEDLENMGQELTALMGGEDFHIDGQQGDTNAASAGAAMPLSALFKNVFSDSQSASGEADPAGDTKRNKGKEDRKKTKFISQYCQDLTEAARVGKLDPVIGREQEIFRVIQILNRRQKNNPCLIGEPGVGKTAIAEGLALRIAAGTVPGRMRNKQVQLLDLTALVAGTQFRGQFESRVKGLIDEVKSLGNVILVIDEVHNLVGAGDVDGAMNAANIMKPALSRGEIQVIGATTFNEYRKHIEKDAALERRFQPVPVDEPSVELTIQMLEGLRSYYSDYHKIKISDQMIAQAVLLSERYITDRYLPDKAIDLLDEAASRRNLISKQLADYHRVGEELKQTRAEAEAIVPDGSSAVYQQIAAVKVRECALEEELAELKKAAESVELTLDDLAQVIEMWTKIPASKVRENESQRLLQLEERLKQRIVGQDEAIDALAGAIRRTRLGIGNKAKPASFIFVGPTGVGKTELVRVLAADLFDTPENLVRLDMSEYMEKHSVSRIIGSPPGYVGYDEAGQLTEKIRRKPYSVVLFDEIEKAHPDVLNILLQILDEGKITDAHGRNINFEHTIIVMTSNAGSHLRDGVLGFAQSAETSVRDKAMKSLNEFLRPEFINRVDEIIVFKNLDEESFARIAIIMLTDMQNDLRERGIHLTFHQSVVDLLVEKSFSKTYGARNLRRTLQKEVEDKIATMLLESGEQMVTELFATAKDGEVSLLNSMVRV